jgi:glycosyltransferase involved in cell wall biosynthesis
VSIVIPTHNSSDTLRTCLESVKKQNYPLREVIVADNFSDDGTISIAKEFKVTILTRCGRPGNPGSAKNVGIMKSSGKYVLLLDSDEVLARDVVRSCVKVCEKENVGMVKIPLLFVGTEFWGKCSAFWKNCHYLVGKQTVGSVPRFFLKEVIIRVGLFDESLIIGEDWELYFRLKKTGVKEAYCNSKMLHLELPSIGKIMAKELHYSRFTPFYYLQSREKYVLTYKNSLLSLREALKGFRRSPQLVAGSLFLLFVKTYIWIIRLVFF